MLRDTTLTLASFVLLLSTVHRQDALGAAVTPSIGVGGASGGKLVIGSGTIFQLTYARRLGTVPHMALHFEVPAPAIPLQDVATSIGAVPRNYDSFFVTPGLQVKLAPTAGVSPWFSVGGGYALSTRVRTAHTPPFALMLFDFATRYWTELANTPVGYPSWSRDSKYIYLQDFTDADRYGSGRIVRMRLSDRKLEPLLELKKVGRLTLGTITPWSGVAPDGSPLLTRDVSAQEIYSLDWHPP